jgi:DNA-directed RNA polymerase I subunit RPA49
MSEKKRKRRSENGDRPAKKVAIDLPASTVKVSFQEDNDVLGPVIGKMPKLIPFM